MKSCREGRNEINIVSIGRLWIFVGSYGYYVSLICRILGPHVMVMNFLHNFP